MDGFKTLVGICSRADSGSAGTSNCIVDRRYVESIVFLLYTAKDTLQPPVSPNSNQRLGLRSPNTLDTLSQADIIRLKLVPAPADDEDRQHGAVVEQLSGLGHSLLRKVVYDDRSASSMSVWFYAWAWLMERVGAYWKPMCEWIRIAPISRPSINGLREPAANGAIVRGMRAAERALW